MLPREQLAYDLSIKFQAGVLKATREALDISEEVEILKALLASVSQKASSEVWQVFFPTELVLTDQSLIPESKTPAVVKSNLKALAIEDLTRRFHRCISLAFNAVDVQEANAIARDLDTSLPSSIDQIVKSAAYGVQGATLEVSQPLRPIMEMPLGKLSFDRRTKTVLNQFNISLIGDLVTVEKQGEDFIVVPMMFPPLEGIGPKIAHEIEQLVRGLFSRGKLSPQEVEFVIEWKINQIQNLVNLIRKSFQEGKLSFKNLNRFKYTFLPVLRKLPLNEKDKNMLLQLEQDLEKLKPHQ